MSHLEGALNMSPPPQRGTSQNSLDVYSVLENLAKMYVASHPHHLPWSEYSS